MKSTFSIQLNGKSQLAKEETLLLLTDRTSSLGAHLANHGITIESVNLNVNNLDESAQLEFNGMNDTLKKFMDRVADSLPKKEGWENDGDIL